MNGQCPLRVSLEAAISATYAVVTQYVGGVAAPADSRACDLHTTRVVVRRKHVQELS